MRNFLAFAMLAGLATPAVAALTFALPPYTVVLTLSDKAAARLSGSHETVHINALYFGEAIKPSDGDEMGEVQLGTEDADIPGAGEAQLGKIALKASDIAKIKDSDPQLLINVYTSRKVFEDNLLDCGIFQDSVTVAAKAPIAISCKLIGE
jgi:hypothetical protein